MMTRTDTTIEDTTYDHATWLLPPPAALRNVSYIAWSGVALAFDTYCRFSTSYVAAICLLGNQSTPQVEFPASTVHPDPPLSVCEIHNDELDRTWRRDIVRVIMRPAVSRLGDVASGTATLIGSFVIQRSLRMRLQLTLGMTETRQRTTTVSRVCSVYLIS